MGGRGFKSRSGQIFFQTFIHLFNLYHSIYIYIIYIYISRMIKIEYPTMMPLARRIQKDTKRLDSDTLIGRMKNESLANFSQV